MLVLQREPRTKSCREQVAPRIARRTRKFTVRGEWAGVLSKMASVHKRCRSMKTSHNLLQGKSGALVSCGCQDRAMDESLSTARESHRRLDSLALHSLLRAKALFRKVSRRVCLDKRASFWIQSRPKLDACFQERYFRSSVPVSLRALWLPLRRT